MPKPEKTKGDYSMGLFGLVVAAVDLADAIVSPVIETAEEIVKDITEEIK